MKYKEAILHIPKRDSEMPLSMYLKKPWYVYFYYKDPVTGELEMIKRKAGINRYKTVNDRKKEGAMLRDEINDLLREGWNPYGNLTDKRQEDLSHLSVIELLERFCEIKKSSVRPRSWYHYKFTARLIKGFLDLNYSVEMASGSFSRYIAQEFMDYLSVNKKYTGRSHNNQLSNCKILFNMMIEREVIVKNPFAAIRKKPMDVGKNIAFSDKQRKVLRDYMERDNHPLYMFVQFMYYCFTRPNELMQLQVKHINFKTGQLNIPSAVSKNRKQSSVEIPKKFLIQVKQKYESLDPELFMFGQRLIPSPIAVHRNRASHSHKLILDDLKIAGGYTLYSWKHTGVVAFVEAGGNVYALMRQLRHHSLDQTMTYLKTLGLSTNTAFSENQPDF